MNTLYGTMLRCLFTTLIIETILAFILGVRDKKDFINIVLVNILTNPLVVSMSIYINIRYGVQIRDIWIIFLELSVFIIEGCIYLKVMNYKKINAFVISLLLNFSSYFIGEIINYINF